VRIERQPTREKRERRKSVGSIRCV